MFSGIVEEAATVVRVTKDGGNVHLTIRASFVDELKIDQSVAHNGVCPVSYKNLAPPTNREVVRHRGGCRLSRKIRYDGGLDVTE